MALQKALLSGVLCVVDSSAPTVPLTDLTGDGGDIAAHNADVLRGLNSVITSDGTHAYLAGDSRKLFFGAGNDAEIYFDGANLVINPRAVGSGYTLMPGGLLLGDPTLAAPLVIQTGVKTSDAVLMYFGSAGASPLVLAVGIVGSATPSAQGISLSATEPGVSDDRPMILQRYGGRVGVGIDNPVERLEVNGNVKPTGYKSSDGTAGATADVAVAKVGGGTRTIHYKNGLYTGHTDS